MSARGLDVRSLRDARVRAMLDQPPILAEPAGGGGAWWLVVALGAGLLVLACWRGWGEVDAYTPIGTLGWTAYFAGGLLVARGLFGALRRGAPAGWPSGRFVYPFGFVDTRGPVFRVLPIEDFVEAKTTVETGNDLALHTIEVTFTGAPPERFSYATIPGRDPVPRLSELRADHPEQLVPAGTPAPRPRIKRPWLLALVAGLAAQALAFGYWLPSRSVGAAFVDGSPGRWTAVEGAFPFGWVRAEASEGIARYFDKARKRLGVHEPARTGLLAAIDQLALEQSNELGLAVVLADPHELDVATEQLRKTVGADASHVIFKVDADSRMVQEVEKLLDGTGLRVRGHVDPLVLISAHVRADGIVTFESPRAYATLAVDVDAAVVAGGKTYPLGPTVSVARPDTATATQLVWKGEKPRPISEVDDIGIYSSMFADQVFRALAIAVARAR